MPTLNNEQHECFARHTAAGQSFTEAAKLAGFPANAAANAGSRLAKQKDVRERIQELSAANGEQPEERPLEVKRQWIESKLVKIVEIAFSDRDLTAANRSLELLARLKGFLIERKEAYTETQINFRNLSPAQLQVMLQDQIERLPEAERALIEGIDASS